MPEYAGNELPKGRVPMTRRRHARMRRLARQGPSSGTVKRHGWRRSAVDEEVLDFAGRFGALTIRQAAEHFYGGSYETARRRISYMAQAGLLERSDNLRWAVVVYTTAAGLVATRLRGHPELRALVPSDERMLHRLLVSETALRLHRRGVRVVAERQLRALERGSAEAGEAEKFAELVGVRTMSVAAGSDGPVVRPSLDAGERDRWWGIPVGQGDELHWPDFVAVVGGQLIAVEVEIAVKHDSRVLQVLRGYRQAIDRGHIRQVLWHVTPDVQQQLEGRRTERGWQDGLLQRTGFLPAGTAPDWSVKGQPMVVRRVEAADEGVVYALSQRVLEPQLRSAFKDWKLRRRAWEESGTALDFEGWLRQPR